MICQDNINISNHDQCLKTICEQSNFIPYLEAIQQEVDNIKLTNANVIAVKKKKSKLKAI